LPSTVLIVKLAAIGDVVMALPMVTAVRSTNRAAHIAWLCGRSVEPLLQCVEGIDELIALDDERLLRGTSLQRAAVVATAWRRLAGRRFDCVFVAHSDPRYRLLVRGTRAAEVRSLAGGAGRTAIVPGRAHADEYVRLVTGLDDHRARSFPIPAVHFALSDSLVAQIPADRPIVALAPGGASNVARDSPLRRWPIERYVALARKLVEAGFAVVVTGADSDRWVTSHFAGLPLLDCVGRTDLPTLLALYARCTVVVTHDSGPMHLAGLAGALRVALFGPTSPQSFARPDSRTRILWPAGTALACAPCYDGRDFAACDNNVCMQAIGVDECFERIVEVAAC
jgi:heptosyltransferase-2